MMRTTETQTDSSGPQQQVHHWNETATKANVWSCQTQAFSRPKSFSRHHRCKKSLKNKTKQILPCPMKETCPIIQYSKCCMMILNTPFRHSDVHPFGLALPAGTWGEIKTYIQYKIWSLFYLLEDKETILGAFMGWSYGPSSLTQRVSVLIGREASADRCGWGRGHDASSPASSLLSTVDTGVGAAAAFLVSGWGLWKTQRQKIVNNTVNSPPPSLCTTSFCV